MLKFTFCNHAKKEVVFHIYIHKIPQTHFRQKAHVCPTKLGHRVWTDACGTIVVYLKQILLNLALEIGLYCMILMQKYVLFTSRSSWSTN